MQNLTLFFFFSFNKTIEEINLISLLCATLLQRREKGLKK
jgi:hypothetical protein